MTQNFDHLQWGFLLVGAFAVGLSKTGLPGLGILFVALFSLALDARVATGVVLPLLIAGDILATFTYRRHLAWRQLWRLFPWTIAGVALGWVALKQLDAHAAAKVIGAILVVLVIFTALRRFRTAPATPPPAATGWRSALTGVPAGFCTMVANAAGPIMSLYLLQLRLPKLDFMGTCAVFFLLLNWFKVPFMANLGLITADSLRLNLVLLPAVIAGAVAGRWALHRINQSWFENITLALAAAAAVRLLVG